MRMKRLILCLLVLMLGIGISASASTTTVWPPGTEQTVISSNDYNFTVPAVTIDQVYVMDQSSYTLLPCYPVDQVTNNDVAVIYDDVRMQYRSIANPQYAMDPEVRYRSGCSSTITMNNNLFPLTSNLYS